MCYLLIARVLGMDESIPLGGLAATKATSDKTSARRECVESFADMGVYNNAPV
jgi:hypothetical protein